MLSVQLLATEQTTKVLPICTKWNGNRMTKNLVRVWNCLISVLSFSVMNEWWNNDSQTEHAQVSKKTFKQDYINHWANTARKKINPLRIHLKIGAAIFTALDRKEYSFRKHKS